MFVDRCRWWWSGSTNFLSKRSLSLSLWGPIEDLPQMRWWRTSLRWWSIRNQETGFAPRKCARTLGPGTCVTYGPFSQISYHTHLKSLYHSVLWQVHIVVSSLIYRSLHIVFGDLITSDLTVMQSRFQFLLPLICSVYLSTYFPIVFRRI